MTDPYTAINKADDVAMLLDSIGWKDVIQPELRRYRESLANRLMAAVLNGPVTMPDGSNLTKEQIAGIMYGVDWVEKLFLRILKDGASAFKHLAANSELT